MEVNRKWSGINPGPGSHRSGMEVNLKSSGISPEAIGVVVWRSTGSGPGLVREP